MAERLDRAFVMSSLKEADRRLNKIKYLIILRYWGLSLPAMVVTIIANIANMRIPAGKVNFGDFSWRLEIEILTPGASGKHSLHLFNATN